MEGLLIIGAGGHGKVVVEAAELENKYNEIAFLDDNSKVDKIYDFHVVGKIKDYKKFKDKYKYAFVAIGNNKVRLDLIDELLKEGFIVPSIIHPRATVSKYSKLDFGTIVLSGSIVNVNCSIGKGCILNINSTLDHDSTLEDGVHVSSGAVIRSMVRIGELSTIKAGACITQGQIIEKSTVINPGTVI